MALFYTESLSICCADVQAEKQWWIAYFDCKETTVPSNWDDPLPADVALKLPGADEPTIALSDRREVELAGYECPNQHALIFCSNVKKAHAHLQGRGASAGAIQQAGGTQFFELSDPEGNIIEICKEP